MSTDVPIEQPEPTQVSGPDQDAYWLDMLSATTKNALDAGLSPEEIQAAVENALTP